MSVEIPHTTAICHALRQCRLFQDLPEKELLRIAQACAVKNLSKGHYLFHANQKAEGFYVVRTGAINVHSVSPDGKEQVIAVFRPFEPFAEITLTTIDTYPADAVATEASSVILVRKNDFRHLVIAQPELALHMLTSVSFHLKHLVRMIEDLQFKQIESRLANWLLRRCPATPERGVPSISLDVTKKVLASQLGVTSETFSRTLARFRDERLIEVNGNNITLLDCAGLRRYVET